MIFDDREDAGRQLAGRLAHLVARDVVVLGLPHGGVPVAAVVARALAAPLDVIVTRRLGVAFQPGVTMGAIGEEGALVLDEDVLRTTASGEAELADIERRERGRLAEDVRRYRAVRPPEPLAGRVAVIVDDGAVSGSTARVACRIARARGASRVVLATPVCSGDALAALRAVADEVVVLTTLRRFHAVGEVYTSFPVVGVEEIAELLRRGGPVPSTRPLDGEPTAAVEVDTDRVRLPGYLTVPVGAQGLVVSAHASGSSRFDPRHRETARYLRESGLATLVIDLLTTEEEIAREHVFDVDLLAARLGAVVADAHARPVCRGLPVALLAESTAGAAALVTAARRDDVAAVVCCEGRPDLVTAWLAHVTVPVLLVVGDRTPVLAELNRRAREELPDDSRLRVVMGSGRADGERVREGAPTRAAELARDWFARYLTAAAEAVAVTPGGPDAVH
ncbi:phosphoribosyltransferase family protein [Actinomycetospora sp. C-140]